MLSDRKGSTPLPLDVLVDVLVAAPEGIIRLPVVNGAEARRGLGAMMTQWASLG